MNRDLILAVDGGGSSSQVALYDISEDTILEDSVGSLSLKSSSADDVLAEFQKLNAMIAEHGGEIRAACLGLSGMDTKEDVDQLAKLMQQAGFAKSGAVLRKCPFGHKIKSVYNFNILLCSDAILPLFANGFKEGVVVISGTGSIALRIDANGGTTRFGGWGYAVSDAGSGTWIGQEFVKKALDVSDYVVSRGKEPSGKAKSLLIEAWTATTGRNPISSKGSLVKMAKGLQEWSMGHSNAKEYAALARHVVESRNTYCREISKGAQKKLGHLASLAAYPKCGAIVFSGGIFLNSKFAKGTIENIELAKNRQSEMCSIVINELPQTYGAFKIAQTISSLTPESPKASSNAVKKSMQGNKGENTKPEMLVRKALRENGITGYRLHWSAPGKPDIAWPGKKVCIFINGCFWHRHKNCKLATMPKSNTDYWIAKFDRNVERDAENLEALTADGWKVHTIWECELSAEKIQETIATLVGELRAELGE